MKHLRFQLFAVLLCLLCSNSYAANVLRVDSVRYPAGKTVSLPILLENSSDITGVQFDISVPYELETDASGNVIVQLSKTRAASHVYTTKSLGTESRNADTHGGVSTYYKYRIIVYSDQNALLLDNAGTLLTVNLTTSIELKNGAVLPVYLLDNSVTLSNREKQNVLTSQVNGAITIEEIPRPDLMPSNVTFDGTSVTPGSKLSVSWNVKNIGQVATDDGWSEQISLVTVGGNLVKTIATTYYDQRLSAGSQVSRTAEIMLPTLLGLDGACKVQVTVVPTEKTGEHVSLRDNNTAQSSKNISVGKLLTLELSHLRVVEGSNQRVTAKLSRSGRWNNVRTFTISSSPTDSRLELPTTVSIPMNQSGMVFYINVGNNNKVDNDSVVTISITGDNYEAATARIVIEDDEFPELTVKSSESVVTEGESFDLTITTPRVSSEPVSVSITSENNKRFKFPSQVTIPAGKSSVKVTVQTVDDELPNLEESNKFTVSAAKFNRGEAIVLLQDNDMPVLTLTLTPDKVGEAAGPTAVSAVLTRTGKADNKVTIKLNDNANGGLYYGNKTLEMAAGVETLYFNLGPVDNAIVDGDRTYTITAGIWVSSCNCASSGEAAGNVSATLTVLDNDGAALAISSQASTVKEGGQTKLTIKRNTTENSQPLTFSISANDETDLTFPKTVTIPAGQQSVDVDVVSKKNNVSGDSRTIVFTVSSSGYSSATCFLLITDQTLPDARIAELTSDVTEAMVGSTVLLKIKVVNEGVSSLPVKTPVAIYRDETLVTTIYTQTEIPVDGFETLEYRTLLPDKIGQTLYHVVVNEKQAVNELVFTNNTSAELAITSTSPFTATVQTDRPYYRQGDKVIITGQLMGEQATNTTINVYIINDGVREVKSVWANSQGKFSLEWPLYDLLSGHFSVGACYKGDTTNEEMTGFDVYGLKRANKDYITCDVTCGEPYNGIVKLVNAGTLPLTGVKTEIVGAPEGCDAKFSIQPNIAGGESVNLAYSLAGSVPTEGNNWDMLKVRVTSNEGAFLEVPLHYYARLAKGNLVVENQNLVTTMNKDNGRDYSFIVTNTGRGNTGKISLSLPDFMTPLTGATMTGLNQNDTATIVLRMMPTANMQLNVPITGMLGINCENGNGTFINFTITPVSDAKGTLVIDVCDEYTYYTEEKPHVKNAEIVLRNPITGGLVAEGVSDENGLFTIELPEGYYQVNVTADKHDAYKNNVLVDPGSTTTKVINLSYQAITVTWDVEETEVEDVYNIVTTVQYETNVPMPVVETIVPERVEVKDLGEGESVIFYAVLTNKGLIAAQNTSFTMPEEEGGYRWEPLVENVGFTLAPQQSYTIPVKVTRIVSANNIKRKASGTGNGCTLATYTYYEAQCGNDWKIHDYKKDIPYLDCGPEVLETILETTGGGLRGPNGWGGNGSYSSNSSGGAVSTDDSCNPCLSNIHNLIMDIIDCPMGFIPGLGDAWAYLRTAYCYSQASTAADHFWCTVGAANTVASNFEVTKPFTGFIGCGLAVIDIARGCGAPNAPKAPANLSYGKRRAESHSAAAYHEPSWVTEYKIKMESARAYLNALQNYYYEFFGDKVWCDLCPVEEIQDLLSAMELSKDKGKLNADALRVYKPMDITDEQFNTFIERMNNTLAGKSVDNMIHQDVLEQQLGIMESAHNKVKADGYYDIEKMMETEYNKLQEHLKNDGNSVCATISLQIEQTMTMTRQAFRGTLSITNGNGSGAMRDIRLKLNVTNKQTGLVATAKEFEMHTEKLKMFEGDLDMESGWYLGADSTGTATILFIPSKYAAPTEPVDYSFGGTLSYIDPYTGLEVTRELYPVTLTVKPSPEIDLTYFMQRDIYGDDALTDAVEPMVPGEFAVILNNKGYGDATNVRMVTQQPKIIENEKGLYIDFEFLSSQLNGQEKTLAMGESIPTDFGTIPAHSQAYALWWLQSTLLGHFVDYNIEATHVTSYGNENLSLLDQVTIHELIHGFTPTGMGGRAFLVNDISDSDDLPDQVYFTDATQTDVTIAVNAIATKQGDTEYTLEVMPMNAGWNYGNVLDPTVGRQKLIKVIRQRDNKELPLDNVWQTDRTLIDGKNWLYENRLHFVGDMVAQGETYLLTFEPKPEKELEVEKFEGVPAEGTLSLQRITEVTVTFNKTIDAKTFTTADLALACQGTPLDASKISIAKVDDRTFKLGFTELSTQNGYYVLTVQTAEITDGEGFRGATGKQATWVQFAEGKVLLTLNTSPANGGKVTPSTGQYDYEKSITLTATPNEGYEFVNWITNASSVPTVVSYNTSLEYIPKQDATLTAVFQPKKVNVIVNYREGGGTIEGGGTGIYAYGTELTLKATPADGYQFDGWMIDSVRVAGLPDANTLTLTVTKPVQVDAMFSVRPDIILSGRVTSSVDGTPIGNATITLTHDDIVYTTTTDRFGRYTIQVDDRTLTYAVHCEAPGYIWSANGDIWFDETAKTKDFVLLQGETVLVPTDGIFAFSPNVDVKVEDLSVTVWYVTEFDNSSFVMKQVTSGNIKAGEGVIIVGTPQDRLDMSAVVNAPEIPNNMLIGTGTTPYEVKDDNVFVLKERADSRKLRIEAHTDAHFYRAAKGTVIPEGKAYIHYTLDGLPDEVSIIWDDASLINMVKRAIENEENHYGLDGRPIYKMDKGIHILKGRKVIVK